MCSYKDKQLTRSRFYWAVNVGALSPLITVNVEAHVSFWAAYLIPLVYVRSILSQAEGHLLTHGSVIVIAATVFISGSKRFVKTPPHGSAVIDAVKIVTIAVKEGGFDNARPSALQARGALEHHRFAQSPNFTDKSVNDVQTGITACKVYDQIQCPIAVLASLTRRQFFLFLPLYFVCWIQIWNNLISQAGAMALHGTPNDLLQNLDPIALIVFIPLLDCES